MHTSSLFHQGDSVNFTKPHPLCLTALPPSPVVRGCCTVTPSSCCVGPSSPSTPSAISSPKLMDGCDENRTGHADGHGTSLSCEGGKVLAKPQRSTILSDSGTPVLRANIRPAFCKTCFVLHATFAIIAHVQIRQPR